jgi:hypothetical protein
MRPFSDVLVDERPMRDLVHEREIDVVVLEAIHLARGS